jgi:predicted DNA-binding protein (MmcQ/YjbR family)
MSAGKPGKGRLARLEKALRKAALAYPGAKEAFPWGDRVVKVNGKVFVFMGWHEGRFGMSVKLPHGAAGALTMPFAKPTGYGLGKSGWVSVSFGPKDAAPMPLLLEWLDESYRAIAPRRLAAKNPTAKRRRA